MRELLLLLTLAAAGAAAAAGTVYRWVDDEGRTHFSDTVPDRYRDRARPVELRDDTPSESQRRQAEARAEGERARLQPPSQPPQPPADTPGARLPASAPGLSKRPPAPPAVDADCDTWRRLYQESLDCFGPYRTTRGAPRAEAFERCTPVDEPPPRCGRTLIR